MGSQTGSPSTVVNFGTGIDWTAPNNAATSNNLYATFNDSTGSVLNSKLLYASGFGFTLDSEQVIDGIRLVVERRATGVITDETISLAYPDGTSFAIITPGREVGSNWPASDGTQAYGGTSDIWGRSWTVSEINDSDFGAVVSAESTSALDTGQVDAITVTVYSHTVANITPTGGAVGGGSAVVTSVHNSETSTGGVVILGIRSADFDGSGGSEIGGTALVMTTQTIAGPTTNEFNFVCNGNQVVPPSDATAIVHASVKVDVANNIMKYAIYNNQFTGVDTIRFRGPATEGTGAGTQFRVEDEYGGSITDPVIIAQRSITSEDATNIINGLWYIFFRDDQAGEQLRGQIVNRSSSVMSGYSLVPHNIDSTGGAVAGGRAPFIDNIDTTGGIEAGGTAQNYKLLVDIATGGAEVAGTNEHVKISPTEGIGGGTLAGNTVFSATYNVDSTDGALAGGRTIVGIEPYIEPAGVEAGGENVLNQSFNPAISGGAAIAPKSRLIMFWLNNPVEDGGGKVGGQARKERIRALQKALISGIGNSMFTKNILTVEFEEEKLLTPPTVEELPELPTQVYFDVPPTWCFIDENVAEECCAVISESGDIRDCDAAVPRVVEQRQKDYLPPKVRT